MRGYDDLPEDLSGMDEPLIKIDILGLKQLDSFLCTRGIDRARALRKLRNLPRTGTLSSIKESIAEIMDQVRPVGLHVKYVTNKSRKVKQGTLLITITEPEHSKPWWKFW